MEQLVYYCHIQAVGMSNCRINDMDASLRTLQYDRQLFKPAAYAQGSEPHVATYTVWQIQYYVYAQQAGAQIAQHSKSDCQVN